MNAQQINFIKIPFIKMHGLGNDFMVIDAREQHFTPSPELMMRLANRRTGVGFDQAVVLRSSSVADVFMQIINADGSEVAACGNATRCVAMHLMQGEVLQVKIETLAGVLQADYISHERVVVQMGVPKLQWQQIPLSHEMDTLAVEHNIAGLPNGVAVSMGNPHLVIFVADVEAVDLTDVGAMLEFSSLFPERANITIAQKLHDSHIKIRTWERGVGITQACGTAACASMVAGRLLGLLEQSAKVTMVGGDVMISWQGHGEQVLMEGDAAYSFYGQMIID